MKKHVSRCDREERRERPRKRAPRSPPDFEEQAEQVLAYGRIHCRLYRPEIVSWKRLDRGRTAALLRDARGAGVTLILDRQNQVMDVDEAGRFCEMEEVLQ